MAPPEQFQSEAATLAGLEWARLWEALEQRLATGYGREAAAALRFLAKVGAVRAALDTVEAMAALLAERGTLSFAGVATVGPLLERAEKEGALEAEELFAVFSTQDAALRLARTLRDMPEVPLLNAIGEACHPEAALTEALGRALTPEGALNEAAFPELAQLRREVSRRRDAIHKKLDAALRSRELSQALQEKLYTLRGARYVLPVKADFRGQVPGIVHDVSASGATLFIEPHTVVEESNALVLAEKQIEARIAAILAELSARVGESAAPLRENLGWLGRLDLLHAQAVLGNDYQGSKPEVGGDGEIALKGVANPLMLLEGERVVRNDFALGEGAPCMVISGANTGGKTVLLKSVGLCALLVSCGMLIPARPGSRFDLFAEVRADIGDQQSLTQSLSTFSAQLRFMSETLAVAAPRTLVLIDEILTGTDPREGAALACALLEKLAEYRTRCLVATHYGEVKELAAAHPDMVNASVAFDLETLSPTYRLVRGTPGISYAFPIARRYGLGEGLVSEATARMAGRPEAADALLAELHRQEQRLRERGGELAGREAEAERLDEKLARRERTLAEKEWRVRQQERGIAGEELEAARRRIAAVIKELQNANSLPLAGKVRDRLEEVRAQVEAELAPTPEPGGAEPVEPDRLAAGDPVLVRSLERVATLSEVLPRGRRARVKLGTLSMEVAGRSGRPEPRAGRRQAHAGRHGSGGGDRGRVLLLHLGEHARPAGRAAGHRAGAGRAVPGSVRDEARQPRDPHSRPRHRQAEGGRAGVAEGKPLCGGLPRGRARRGLGRGHRRGLEPLGAICEGWKAPGFPPGVARGGGRARPQLAGRITAFLTISIMSADIVLKVRRHYDGMPLPTKAHRSDAGFDLTAMALEKLRPRVFSFDTGVSLEVEDGFYCEVVPRSGIVKSDFMQANGVGVIDPDYRGRVMVVLRYLGEGDGAAQARELVGQRIAQLLVRRLEPVRVVAAEELMETGRGDGGFGSTGK
jgi:DNA mismatch repair protein MutS2